MKKLLTIVLSLVMVMSMTAVSFADETNYEDIGTVEITKTVNQALSVDETYEFSVEESVNADAMGAAWTSDMTIPTFDDPSITIVKGETTGSAVITLPEYDVIGEYIYTISENEGNTAGLDYTKQEIVLKVTVIYDEETEDLIRIPYVTKNGTGYKAVDFDNTYKAGTLTVTKNVTGVLGDREEVFPVDVTFTTDEEIKSTIYVEYNETLVPDPVVAIFPEEWTGGTVTKTIYVSDDTKVTFTNVPVGVSYTVNETDAKEHEVSYADNKQTGTIDEDGESVDITNNKGATIDTGIILDNGLYIILLAGVAVAAGMFFMKRRQDDYDM